MKKILLFCLLPMLWACSNDVENDVTTGTGSISLRPTIETGVIDMRSTSTDVSDLTIILTDSEGVSTSYSYPEGGTIGGLATGNYTILLTTHPDGFPVPAFETPVYEGSKSISVSSGATTPVEIKCTQVNAGLFFVYDSTLIEAGLENVVPTITHDSGTLVYEGEYREQKGYFPTGMAIVSINYGSTPVTIGGSLTKQLDLEPRQLWQITLKHTPGSGSLDIIAEIDVTTIGKNLDFELDLPEPLSAVWNSNSLQRMNLKGAVASVDYHINVAREGVAIFDMNFNEQGWLTSFIHEKWNYIRVNITITYDEQNRIREITGKSAEDDYAIRFTYADHGKYITTEEIFNEVGSWNMNVAHLAWMPTMIRDLASVKTYLPAEGDLFKGLEFDFNGSEGTGYIVKSSGEREECFDYTFSGDYIESLVFSSGWYAMYCEYTMDIDSGCLIKNDQGDVAHFYNIDRLNTFKGFTSEWMDDTWYTYNSNLDVIKVEAGAEVTEYDYDYDDRGNWYNMFNETNRTYIDRTITYRD